LFMLLRSKTKQEASRAFLKRKRYLGSKYSGCHEYV
jgi:hypothetical protein